MIANVIRVSWNVMHGLGHLNNNVTMLFYEVNKSSYQYSVTHHWAEIMLRIQ